MATLYDLIESLRGISPKDAKTYSEIARNYAAVLGILGAVFAFYKWLHERKDRSTAVLFELETRFNSDAIRKGRALVDDDKEYSAIRKSLVIAGMPPDKIFEACQTECEQKSIQPLAPLDDLLRFYVLICGVRKARQVKDVSLRTCFRYWLAEYYNPDRRELRFYINNLYPTLNYWLQHDRTWVRRRFGRCFFGPERFGWRPERVPTKEEIGCALTGRVMVITGSGVSKDSGIPTYRGKEGYWRNYNPKKLATRAAFRKDPKLVWEWYYDRRKDIAAAKPNPAHHLIAKLSRLSQGFLLVTQNVDDLHERAGIEQSKLVQIHGKIFENKCSNPKCGVTFGHSTSKPYPQHCPKCHSLQRPDVVWFDEDLDKALVRKIEDFIDAGDCDLVLVIGTTATFDYIVDWAIRAAGSTGCLLEINPEATIISDTVDLSVRKGAKEGLLHLFGHVLK